MEIDNGNGYHRVFDTGATRDSDADKLDFDGFFHPTVMIAFSKYMHKNRKLKDGTLRDSDNWTLGIPQEQYMKSMWRHHIDCWCNSKGIETEEDEITNLCALMFNVQGLLYEKLRNK